MFFFFQYAALFFNMRLSGGTMGWDTRRLPAGRMWPAGRHLNSPELVGLHDEINSIIAIVGLCSLSEQG